MSEHDWLAQRFESHRAHLRAVAYRMLGSRPEAEDAVQEAWLRLSRSDTADVDNLGGWLTTVVARVCLDTLRSRRSRREDELTPTTDRVSSAPSAEHEAQLADSVGLALLVVLDTLGPAERLAFVLHDLFDVPFEEIAPIVGRTPAAARQLASRARRRVRGARTRERDRERQRQVVEAFLAASRGGDFAALLSMLDPEAVLRADATTVALGAAPEVRGAQGVAETFAGRARTAEPALIDGAPGLVWSQGGAPRVVFAFRFDGERIVGIDLVADPAQLGEMQITH